MTNAIINSDHVQGIPQFVNPTKIEKYDTGWFTLASDADTTFNGLANVLTGIPTNIRCWLKLGSAAQGYAVGEIIPINVQNDTDYGLTIYFDSETPTEMGVVTGNRITVVALDDHNIGTLDAANHELRVIAERTVQGDIPDITTVGLVPLEKKVVINGDADVQFNLAQYFQDFEDFEIDYKGLIPVTDGVTGHVQVSADGTTFISSANSYRNDFTYVNNGSLAGSANETTYLTWIVHAAGTASGEMVAGTMKILGAEDSNIRTQFNTHQGGRQQSSGQHYMNILSGQRNASEVTKKIKYYLSSGNWQSGTFILYGKRKVA